MMQWTSPTLPVTVVRLSFLFGVNYPFNFSWEPQAKCRTTFCLSWKLLVAERFNYGIKICEKKVFPNANAEWEPDEALSSILVKCASITFLALLCGSICSVLVVPECTYAGQKWLRWGLLYPPQCGWANTLSVTGHRSLTAPLPCSRASDWPQKHRRGRKKKTSRKIDGLLWSYSCHPKMDDCWLLMAVCPSEE